MIKLTDILFENHPLSAEVQKLEDDLKVKYPTIDYLLSEPFSLSMYRLPR